MPSSSPHVVNLGCRLNLAEGESIRALLSGRDTIVVNSCAVTNEAVKQTRQAIRRARRERPGAELVVTGCAAQIDPAAFAAMPEVDRVIGNAEKLLPTSWTSSEPVQVQDIMAVRETAPHLAACFSTHARAFVEVQNGCDHRCTFCAIPFGRGNSRSVPAGAVIDRIAALAEHHAEIVLTGVDLTSYGPDLPGAPTLGQLVERILAHVPALKRLRLSSLDGVEVDDRLFALLTQEPRLMPHVHLSLQAGDDMILKRMKRRHSRAQSVALAERLHAARPDIAIGADLIAGFPTETEAMFENSRALIMDCGIVHAHIFPYSPRAGTPAARMPQVEPEIVKARAARLRAEAEGQRTRWLQSLVGSSQQVLVERPGDRGHAGNFAEVRLGQAEPVGSIVQVKINAVSNQTLEATPIRHPGLVPGSTEQSNATLEPFAQCAAHGGSRNKSGMTNGTRA
ncbi:tRNA (N(6)-L-threonylcarbamoyladenosine(37)-C(2))-methylthiotransferase MtaB [Sphingomonas sp. JC676]|uniref:tRNA (N(6)-L-threonylcarbamoyladenosine(37)-C(2))- methylthiotransferase MtaB n=1 Tax=Sphingomonas sp. JC676 TaxID=2768065 RepID=UPI0016579E00|nr:tRNA (N(6)-L-threonylcarbamoyladenosine(37)-C(2))-methylthiotransferase MtaB [Sphingomonas sp. JC676]MBC9032088.1 tRNA (N(6)-L-threonylcarbamoyladenosine(37)-C(2))-methylthiotransferase MtaB [Sphingomonas sp. JC676]